MDPMVYPVLLLIVVLIAAVIAVIVDSRNTKLRHRIEALAGPEDSAAEEPSLSIRVAQQSELRFLSVFARLLRIPLDVPGAQKIAPHWVFVLGLIVLVGGTMLAERYAGVSWAMAGVIGLIASVLAQRVVFGMQMSSYQAALQQQLPDAVEMVVSAIRAGLPVGEAFRALSVESPAPTKDEFVRVVNEIALGASADKALLNVFHRTQLTEYAIFAVTINVQSKSGGRLVESVQRLAETIRQRLGMMTRAKALAGEARVSAIILGSLPFVAGAALSAIRPGYLDPLFNDPRGTKMLGFASVTLLLGILLMRRMIRKATAE